MPNDIRNHRDEIVALIKTRLENISVANGYNNNITTIARWRTVPFAPEECPAVVIRDLRNNKTPGNDHKYSEKRTNRLAIQLEVVVAESDVITKVSSFIPDFEKMIALDDELADANGQQLAWYCEPDYDDIVSDQKTKQIAGLVFGFFVVFASDVFGD